MFDPSDMVICDACLRPFNLKAHAFTEWNGDIETVGLKCPHCDTVYISYRTNSEIRELHAKVRKEMERFRERIRAGQLTYRAERRLKKLRRRLERLFETFQNKPQ